jgi:peptidoglycan/LPS O-acetylase OafA/YrhL
LVPNVINVLWTLSYEMAFYLLVVALFTVRMHTRPAAFAVTFSLGAVLFGSLLPVAGLSHAAGIDVIVAIVAATAVCAICCAMSGRTVVRTAGGLVGGVLSVVLITVNGRVGPWQGLAIMAAMFTGTAIHQAERGQLSRQVMTVVAVAVLGCSIFAGVWHSRTWGLPPTAEAAFQRSWTSAMVLAALTFAAGLALRHKRLPRLLTGVGVISYSIYLLHPVLFQSLDHIIGRPKHDNPGILVAALALLLLTSWVAHRLVEAPTQRLGRTVSRRWSTAQ